MNLSIDEALLQAKKHVKNGAFVEAMHLFMAVDQQSPGNKFVRKSINKLQKKLGSDYQPVDSSVLSRLVSMGNSGYANDAINEAERLAEAHPKFEKLWDVLGFLYANARAFDKAIDAYKRCLEINQINSEVYKNLGLAYRQTNDLDSAIVSFQNSLRHNPDGFDALVSLAQIYRAKGDKQKSREYYEKIYTIFPDRIDASIEFAQLLFELGQEQESNSLLEKLQTSENVAEQVKFALLANYRSVGDYASAVKICQELLEVEPNSNLYLQHLGDLHANEGKLDQSEECFRQALRLYPDDLSAINNLGVVLGKKGKLQEAIEYFKRALEIEPSHSDSLFNLGNASSKIGQPEKAIEYFEKTIFFAPNRRDAHTNLGSEYRKLGQPSKAMQCFERATQIDPYFACGFYSMGTVAREMGDRKRARSLYNTALNINPKEPDALTNLGMLDVLEGDFAIGWQRYESRWDAKEQKGNIPFQSDKKQWDGEEQDIRLLFWPEQGVGDQIMYSSVLTDLTRRCAEVNVILDRRIVELIKRSFGTIENLNIYSQDERLSHDIYDQHLPFGSSFMHMRPTLESFKSTSSGYLFADPDKLVRISEDLGTAAGKRRVGISWNTVNSEVGHQRRISLEKLVNCFDRETNELVCLQYGDVDYELADVFDKTGVEIKKLNTVDTRDDIDGLASLICMMDEVVSIDNSTVHLAGALNQRTTVLLPLDPDWRWGIQNSQSYIYSNTSLLRQKNYGDWEDVLVELKQRFR